MVTHASFVVSIFQGGDLCDVDEKTDALHFSLSVSKRNLEKGKKVHILALKFGHLS